MEQPVFGLLFVLFLALTAFLIVGVFRPFLFCGERQHLTVVYLSVACLHANASAWVAYPHSFAVCSQIRTGMKANSTVIIFEIHS